MPRSSRVTLEMEIQIYEAKLFWLSSRALVAVSWVLTLTLTLILTQCSGPILGDCQQFHFSLFRFITSKSLLGEISLGFVSLVIKATISQGSQPPVNFLSFYRTNSQMSVESCVKSPSHVVG